MQPKHLKKVSYTGIFLSFVKYADWKMFELIYFFCWETQGRKGFYHYYVYFKAQENQRSSASVTLFFSHDARIYYINIFYVSMWFT